MGALDVVELPGHPGHYMRRVAVDAWIRAGRPRPRSTGRLYSEQKYLFDGWRAGKPGFYPADNPDATWMQLSHVRFVAIDIWDNYSYWRPKMLAAGWLPLSHEPWHFYLPNPQQYALVTSIPASATGGSTAFPAPIVAPQEDDMSYPVTINKVHRFHIAPGFIKHFENVAASDLTKNIISADDKWIDLDEETFKRQLDSFGIPRWCVDTKNGGALDVSLGKIVAGGMWSWAREAANTSATVAKAVSALSVVTPPKA